MYVAFAVIIGLTVNHRAVPIYLDHVIVPTLTDAGCYTEVHHIDGSGHDAGYVVQSWEVYHN
jgi:hypothetical protein